MAEAVDGLMARRMQSVNESSIGAVLRLGDPTDLISLAGGLPAPETFGAGEMGELIARIAESPTSFQYGDTGGLASLREWIAAFEGDLVGRGTSFDEIVITSGAQQGLDLVCRLLADPGDIVIVDRPTYLGALQVFRSYEVRLSEVPIASDPSLAALEAALIEGSRPKFVYVVPTFANPTGLSLDESQRRRLAAFAEQYGFVVVEDDPYRHLYYSPAHAHCPPIAACSDRVLRIGSFSKLLFPAARVGYIHAPRLLADPLRVLKQASDLGNSHFLQQVVYALVQDEGGLAERMDRARRLYRCRRDALKHSLEAHAPDALSFEHPDGGFFIWAAVHGEINADALLKECLKLDLTFVPGQPFYAFDGPVGRIRLSFSTLTPERAPEAARRLARAWAILAQPQRTVP